MKIPEIPQDELKRLRAVRSLEMLDTEPEERFEQLTRLAQRIFGTSMVLISLVDKDRQWFKSRIGCEVAETSRDLSFCAHSVASRAPLIVENATLDDRFHDHPLVLAEQNGLKAYAGHPIFSMDGYPVGTFCVAHESPRVFSAEERSLLADLAHQAEAQFHLSSAKRAAEQLGSIEAAHDLLAHALGQIRDAVFLTDVSEGGKIVYVNHAFVRLTRYARDSILGALPDRLFGPLTGASEIDQFKKSLSQGSVHEGLITLYRMDGSAYEAEWQVSPIRDAHKKITHWAAIHRDVTERSNETKRIQQLNSLLQTQQNLAQAAILVQDKDFRLIANNDKFCTLWNLDRDLLNVGNQSTVRRRLIPLMDNPDEFTAGWQAFLNSERDRWLYEVRLKDGRHIEVYGAKSLAEDASLLGWVWYFRDITARVAYQKSLEDARQASEQANLEKSRFLANMSHEIRTPLNGVLGMAELLASSGLKGEQAEFLSTIRASANHLLSLVNDILDLSKIEAGHLELEERAFDLSILFEEAITIVSPRVEANLVECGYAIAEQVPVFYRGDPSRVRQILLNLLGNAAKFTVKGSIFLEVVPDPEETDGLLVSVTDTGPGISKALIGKLFQPFIQEDAASSNRYGGTGLGLSICRSLVDAMGGRIWAENLPEGGAKFSFTLRLPAADASEISPIWLADETVDFSGKGVLVVDDSKVNRRMLDFQFKRLGMVVRLCGGPSQALVELDDHAFTPSVAVLDFDMSEMNGLALAKALRERLPDLPIVLLTSLGEQRSIRQQTDALNISYLNKPAKQIDLIRAMSKVMFGRDETSGEELPKKFLNHEGAPLRILVAEDNEINTKVTQGMLNLLGYEADYVENGAEAVEAWEAGRHDVVLMDIQMPVMDGMDAAKAIRKCSGKSDFPWIVAMTADVMREYRSEFLSVGINDYVYKPISVSKLREVFVRSPDLVVEKAAPPQMKKKESLNIDAVKEFANEFGPEFFKNLVNLFEKDFPARMEALKKAIEDRDAGLAGREAHTIKGASGHFGASSVGVFAAAIQEACRANQWDRASGLLPALDQAGAEQTAALRAFCREHWANGN